MNRGCGRGFSLIEVLVAFALLAGGLGLLISILSGGLQQVRWAQAHSEAMEVARSALDTLGTVEPLQPGLTQGEAVDGRYRWELLVEPYEADAGRPSRFSDPRDAVIPIVLYRVELELSWDGGGPRERVRMSTLRSVGVGAAGIDDGDWLP